MPLAELTAKSRPVYTDLGGARRARFKPVLVRPGVAPSGGS
jgi:hypothetical protein